MNAKTYSRILFLSAFAIAGCVSAPQVAYSPRFDFALIHRVAVVSFDGSKGSVAADMMTQSLVAHGADVVERQQLNAVLNESHLAASGILNPATIQQVGKILGVDALFVGTVVDSVPSQSYVVTNAYPQQTGYPGRRGHGYGGMGAQVTPISGNNVYSQGSVMGVPGSQIMTSAAQVSMVSRMVDVQTGQVLWSASMTYQGLDQLSAITDITDSFINSLVPIWPQLLAVKSS